MLDQDKEPNASSNESSWMRFCNLFDSGIAIVHGCALILDAGSIQTQILSNSKRNQAQIMMISERLRWQMQKVEKAISRLVDTELAARQYEKYLVKARTG